MLRAEAKTAESASVAAERIPRPPSFTGRDAWSQFSSDSSTFKILDSPLLSSESNLARPTMVDAKGCAHCVEELWNA